MEEQKQVMPKSLEDVHMFKITWRPYSSSKVPHDYADYTLVCIHCWKARECIISTKLGRMCLLNLTCHLHLLAFLVITHCLGLVHIGMRNGNGN